MWLSNDTWDLIQEKKILKIKLKTSNDQTREIFKNLHRTKAAEVKRCSIRGKRRFLHNKADKAKQAASRNYLRRLFKVTKKLGRAKKRI